MVVLVMVMNAVEEVAMIGTMTGTMKSTMMLGLLHGRALQPLCGEALLGFNGAARDTPGPGGAETLEEIYGCDGATGRVHLPSCNFE